MWTGHCLMEAAGLNFLLATGAGLCLAGLTFWFARKSGLQPAQAALIDTLKENADALKDQVERLKEEIRVQRDRRISLERKVARLEKVVIELASQNADLRAKLGMPATGPITAAFIDEENGD